MIGELALRTALGAVVVVAVGLYSIAVLSLVGDIIKSIGSRCSRGYAALVLAGAAILGLGYIVGGWLV